MYIHAERTAYSVSPDGHSDSEGEKCHKQWEVSKKVGHLRTHTIIETEIKGKVETETTSYKVELMERGKVQVTSVYTCTIHLFLSIIIHQESTLVYTYSLLGYVHIFQLAQSCQESSFQQRAPTRNGKAILTTCLHPTLALGTCR